MLFRQNEAKKINLFKVRLGKGSNRRGTIAARALDYAVGFLRGMELRRTEWAFLLDDEKRGGWLVPIFALAHEHHPDPEMRPYKGAISTEEREKLIVGAAAGVTEILPSLRSTAIG